jgi:uncharacterized protein (DUF885 family)
MRAALALIALGLVTLGLAGCGGRGDPAAEPPKGIASESFERLAERYWQAYLEQNPLRASATGEHRFDARLGDPLSLRSLAAALSLERRFLAELGGLTPPSAGSAARESYDLFKRQRELAIEGYTYPDELFPVNPFEGMVQEFALMGAGAGPHPFNTSEDFDHWTGRADGFVVWTRQAIENMRDGMRRGYLPPRILVLESVAELETLGADRPDNPFYLPLEHLPDGLDASGRQRLTQNFTEMVRNKILPAYRRLDDFMKNEYLPMTRDVGGLGRLPLGDAWYAHLVRQQTGTNMTPAEARAAASAQVERLNGRMRAALVEAGFTGEPSAYLAGLRQDPRFGYATPADLINACTEWQLKVAALQPLVLAAPVAAPLELRTAPRVRGAFTPRVEYRAASADSTGRALLLVGDSAIAAAAAPAVAAGAGSDFDLLPLYLGAGVPGRHVQATVQYSARSVPRFQRFATEPAISEGWALYAVSLGEELGLYADPVPRFAALALELSSAAAAVVDVGLNADGWTRAQALAYLAAQTPLDPVAAAAIVDRALALPARALAPEIGALGIRALRATAAEKLGGRFDLRLFHAEILQAGALPLDWLRPRIATWIDAVASSAASEAATTVEATSTGSAASAVSSSSPASMSNAAPAQIR